MAKNADFVSHKKSKQIIDGKPKLPLATDLVEGEIAINFGKDVETLSIKNESGDVVTFSSDNYYTEQKLGSGFTGENSGVTVTDTILWVSGTGENSVVQKGGGNTASGTCSVAEGAGSNAIGNYSHAEGHATASGDTSHAEGSGLASGSYSHAEGHATASGDTSHAEGTGQAIGRYSHAEGAGSNAIGNYSHAEGSGLASGSYSHAEGLSTMANNQSEHASGQFNISNSATTEFGNSGNTLFSVGNGTADDARHNAFEIRQNGDIYIVSGDTDILLQDNLGGNIEIDQVIDSGTSASTNAVATKAVVEVIKEDERVTAEALNNLNTTIIENERVTAEALNYLNETVEEDERVTAEALNYLNTNKQDTLSAGTGIIISGNVISSNAVVNIDQVIDSSTSASTGAVSTSAVYGFVTAYTPSITVDQTIDSSTSASTNPVATSAVYDFLAENYYTKDETDDGDEVISASLNDLNTRKLDASAYTPVQVDQVIDSGTSASTDAVSTSAVYGFVTSYTPSITVDQVLDDTTSASTNPVSSKAVYDAVTDNELVWTNAYVALSGAVDTISGSVDTHKANTNIHLLQIVSAVTVSSDMSNVTCPNSITGASNNGAQALVVYENSGDTDDYTITVSTSYKTPDGNQLILTCPANGYCEVSYVNINGTIYVRGI